MKFIYLNIGLVSATTDLTYENGHESNRGKIFKRNFCVSRSLKELKYSKS